MSEEQVKFNIEKQESRRDLFNVAGDYIIHHPITRGPVSIPSIQSVLRKDEIKEGEFFRKEPAWVDYEQDFIVERKEVSEIIKRVEKDRIQLVLGAPASGKSIILKNVGFKLAKENKKIYVVELKKHLGDEIKLLFENIPKIDDESIFIVDDAHLRFSECERLIRNFRSNGKGNLIIGSRETEKIQKGDPTGSSEFEYLSETAITVKAKDVTEIMIKTFLESKHNLSGERIKSVSSNLDEFKKDLWNLSWALKTYNIEKDSVEKDDIYEKIKERIRNINAEDIFLPMSVFYRFEIPIERKFLEKQLGIDDGRIDDLIGRSEIMQIEEIKKPIMLSLQHSSLADLYFNVYQNYPSLGEKIKEKILNQKDEKDLEYSSFYRYLTTADPLNVVDVVINLRRDWSDEKGKLTLLKKLVEEDQIQKSIEKGIEKEEDIENIGICVSYIAGVCQEAGLKLINSIDIDILSSKINKEEDMGKIGICVGGIAGVNKEVGLKLIKSIEIDALSSKIEKHESLINIGMCVGGIAKICKEAGLKLSDSVSSKIEKEENLIEIGLCIGIIARRSKEAGLNLANSIASRIEKEDIEMAGLLMSVIANEEMAREILNLLNPKLKEDLQKRINPDLGQRLYHIYENYKIDFFI